MDFMIDLPFFSFYGGGGRFNEDGSFHAPKQ